MAYPAAGTAHAHAHGYRDGDELADFAHIPYPATNGDRNMDNKPNSDEHEHAYVDRHGERVTYRHVHIFPAVKHANPDPSANLDADNYRDLDADADLHQSAVVPVGNELEREGAKM